MQVFKAAEALRSHLSSIKQKGQSIGFVPTMGALHPGHLSLVRRAAGENDHCVVSIFVNPTQFNNPEDLRRYPRIPEKDIRMLKDVRCDIVFLPEVEEIYPNEVKSEPLDFHNLDKIMEGEFRPGHFQGVATVVRRFFDIIHPDRAYFGEKDYQQLLIIKHLVKHLDLQVEVVPHPIARDERGLALSSRNQLLSEEDKISATAIYRALMWAVKSYRSLNPEEIREGIEVLLKPEPLLLEYAEVCNAENLQPLEDWNSTEHARVFIAAYMGKVRLIDNVSLF